MYSVLMVDDNTAMREALARSLTRRGCRVTTAASGVAGLEPRSLSLFMETERFVLKPLSLDTLWRQVEEVLEGVPRTPSRPRVESDETTARP